MLTPHAAQVDENEAWALLDDLVALAGAAAQRGRGTEPTIDLLPPSSSSSRQRMSNELSSEAHAPLTPPRSSAAPYHRHSREREGDRDIERVCVCMCVCVCVCMCICVCMKDI